VTQTNTSNKTISRSIPWMILIPFLAIVGVSFWGFRPIQHVDLIDGKIDVEAGIHTVRILGETGNIQVVIGSVGTVEFFGRALSVVASSEHVEALRASPVTLVRDSGAVPDGVMVLRVSPVPEGFRRIATTGSTQGSPEDRRPGVFRQVDLEIRLPVDLNLRLSAEETNLRVDTRQGSTALDVKSGNVLVMHTSADLEIRNGGGPTVVQEHRGVLDVEVEGQLRVALSELSGPASLTSKAGKVGLYLPAHSSFKVDATSNAAVRNAFGLASQPLGAGGHRLTGEVGGGEHSLSIRAQGGPVTLGVPEK